MIKLPRIALELLIPVPLLLVACAGNADDRTNELATQVDCHDSAKTDVGLTIDSGPGKQPSDQDVRVTGEATQANGLTIRQVIVQGINASNDGFNYSTWSATVPIATLLAQQNDQGQVSLTVKAIDACGQTKSVPVAIQLVAPATP